MGDGRAGDGHTSNTPSTDEGKSVPDLLVKSYEMQAEAIFIGRTWPLKSGESRGVSKDSELV